MAPPEVQPLQVCLALVRLGEAYYPRPCIVLAVDVSGIAAVAVSSRMDLYRPAEHFLISDGRPDFFATGLERTSFAVGAPVARIRRERIQKILGALTADLAREFRKWIE